MNNLKVGFSRINNTPELGAPLHGYTFIRYAEGVLDPLEINTVAFSDGERTAIMITYDSLGFDKGTLSEIRQSISDATGVDRNSIYITASHSHTAPGQPRPDQNAEADRFFIASRENMLKGALEAISDLREARMGFGIGKAENVSFCRRYIMKDGSCRTNPGVNNPDIDHAVNEVDTRVSVIRFVREGAEDVCIVNFANHPDTVGGNMISADWPGLLRETVERVFDNTRCVFTNGCQGDINHVNVHPTAGYANDTFIDFDDVARGYGHTRYIARVVAAGVMQAYDKVEFVDVETIATYVNTILIPTNMPKPEEMPEARYIHKMYTEGRANELGYEGMMLTTKIADANRKIRLENGPLNYEMDIIGIRLGEVAFIGIPGEPFSEIGNQLKLYDNMRLVIPTCLTNGYQGYFPTFDAYREGGYEAGNSNFKAGVAERIIAGGIDVLDELTRL